MGEFLALFSGGFIVPVIGIMAYRYFFDRERWNRALEDGRTAVAAHRAKSQIKLEALKEKHAREAAERKQRFEAKKAELRDKYEREKQARAEMRALLEEDLLEDEARREMPRSRPNRTSGKRRRYREDPLTGAIIGGLAAASLADDFEEAFDDDEHDDDS